MYIWPICVILIGTTTPGQSNPGIYGDEGVFHTLQSFRSGASPLDAGHLYFFGGGLNFQYILCTTDRVTMNRIFFSNINQMLFTNIIYLIFNCLFSIARDVVAYVFGYDIVVSEFELQ